MTGLIDLHCDTIWKLMDAKKNANLEKNDFCVSIEKMKQADTMVQFFACFVDVGAFPKKEQYEKGYIYVKKMIERMKKEVKNYSGKIAFAKNGEEIEKNRQDGKISSILTLEEGGVFNEKKERIDEFWKEGIRLTTILWNYENCIGYPNSKKQEIMCKGLKPFGFEVVEKMNDLGMIIDVSHLSDGGFWDVIEKSKSPIVASHSNAREICLHPRNLTDEMIRALAEKGGVIGVNFYPKFLKKNGKAGVDDIVLHLKHIINVGGIDCACIGTDFDGFSGESTEIKQMGQMDLLYEALQRNGIKEKDIEKIWRENAMRVIKEVI
ncbi:dipeptidase [Faecalimonas sp.]